DVGRLDLQGLLVRPDRRVLLSLQVVGRSQRLPESGRLGEMPYGGTTEKEQLLSVGDLLGGAERGLEDGRIGELGRVIPCHIHEAIQHAAPQLALDADALPELQES